jgi:molecular chaperone HtpG
MNERVVPLTVEAVDILPIIKRFLYDQREIFLRELISNAVDALTKLDAVRLSDPGFVDDGEPLRIEVTIDPLDRIVTIADNGIGMSSEEVIRYINQIAFSGAKEFLDRHSEAQVSLIGKFGLGFYSSFMVSKRIEIESRTWRAGEMACRWVCDGGTSARIEEFQHEGRGTRVICHLEDDAREFLDAERIEKVVHHYLDYAPYPIFVAGRQVNTIMAPWHLGKRERDELPTQRYWDVYERLNPNENCPLGWFHLEIEFPVPFRALLFVPDRPGGAPGNLRLFANRTFICDHCAELLVDWLGFLEGVVDSQDLPLNVARDRFQKDEQVKKLRNYMTGKTLDFFAEMLQKRRKDYVRFWGQCGTYLKRGYFNAVVGEQKTLAAKLEKLLLFPSTRKPFTTLDEYMQRVPDSAQPIFYLTDPLGQNAHLELLRNRNREVLYFTEPEDPLLVQIFGRTRPDLPFARVDQVNTIEDIQPPSSQPPDSAAPPHGEQATDWSPLLELFREVAGDGVNKVSAASLPSRDIPAILSLTGEDVMQDVLSSLIGDDVANAQKRRLVINTNCSLIQNLGRLGAGTSADRLRAELVARIWDNVLLSAGLLEGESLAAAIRRHQAFLNLIAEQLIGNKN